MPILKNNQTTTKKRTILLTGLLLLSPFAASLLQADSFDEIDFKDPATEQLMKTLYGVPEEVEPLDEATTDTIPVVPIVNPPIVEQPLYKDPETSKLYPEFDQPLTEEDEAQVIPIFDEFGNAAKTDYIKASLQNQKGYGSNALTLFISAVEKDPENIWLKNRAAKACLVQSDFVRAEQFANEVLTADPKNYTAMSVLANLCYYRENIAEAKTWYLKILEFKPGNLEALESLARIAYVNERDYDATKDYCARIMKETTSNLNALLWYAEANAITGDITQAGDLYEQLIDYRPSLINRLVDMANRLYREGRLDESEALLQRGVEMLPDSPLVVEQWEQVVTERHGAERVITAYDEIIAKRPLDLKIQETYASYLTRTENVELLEPLRQSMLKVNPHHIPSLLSLARISLAKDDFPKAVEYFEHAINSGPEDPAVFRDIGLVYLEYGKIEKAKELLREAVLLNPEDADTLVALGSLSEQEGNFEKAEATYKLALDASPANDLILRMLGDFYRRRNDPYKASQIFEQLTAVDPSNVTNQVRLAVLYMELNDGDALDRFQANAPLAVDEKYNLFVDYGVMALGYGFYERASWSFEKALQIAPAVLQVRSLMAKTQLHLGNAEDAESVLRLAESYIKDDPEQLTEYNLTLVDYYLASHQYPQAEAIALKLVNEAPDELYHHTLYLDSLLAQPNKQDQVKDVLNNVIKKFSANNAEEIKRVRAEVYKKQKDYKRAISILEPLLEEAPESVDLRFDLADLYGSNNDIAKAEALYRELILQFEKAEQERPLATALNNFAYLYSEHSMNLEEAYAMALKADSLNPRQDFILDTIGWIAFRQKNYQKAEEFLLKAYHFSLNDPEISAHLGTFYEDQNQPQKALEYFTKANSIEPTNEEWSKKVDELTRLIGQASTPPVQDGSPKNPQ